MDDPFTPMSFHCEAKDALPQQARAVVELAIAMSPEDTASARRLPPQPTVSIVIPTMNEAKNLPHVLPLIPRWVHEVILVDGNSSDNTVEVARSLLPEILVLPQQGRGKGAALRTGFAAATGDIIVMIDADGSMNPSEIPAYIGALMTGADFAKGSRFLQGGGTDDMEWFRYLGNLFLTRMVRLGYGGHYSDLCYGYNAFWRRVLHDLNLDADGFEIETQINVRILQARLKISEIPSFESCRIHGVSNLNTLRDGWRVLKTIVSEWVQPRIANAPQKLRHPLVAKWLALAPTRQMAGYAKGDQYPAVLIREG